MADTPNLINKEVPTTITIGTDVINDIVSCDWGMELTTHPNTASMRSYAMDGGHSLITQTLSLTTLDQEAAGLAVGDFTALTCNFDKVGAASNLVKLTLASSAVLKLKSKTSSGSGGHRQYNLSFELFSSDGTTSPLTISLAAS
jgi:hypothetical protein